MEDFAGTAAVTAPAPAGIEFTGRRSALFKIVLKNVLLNVVTLGIYRFWGKTRVRRFFWSNIVIGGEPLEYTGTGLELFIGFLIAMAVLIPLSILQAGIVFVIGPESSVVDVLSFVVVLFLIPFVLFRIWRYRLTRTRWRGIRFRLEGSALRYAGRAFLWLVAQVLTLGIAVPWARFDLARYKLSRVNYGSTAFGFRGSGSALLVPWMVVWLPPALVVAAVIAMSFGEGLSFSAAMSPDGEITMPSRFPAAIGFLPLAVFLFVPLFIWYRVREFRYFIGCLKFANATFESAAKAHKVILPMVFAAGIFLFVFGFLFAILAGTIFGMNLGGGPTGAQILAAFLPLVLLFLVLLFMPLVTYPVVVFTIVKHLWTTLSISDPQAFNRAVQATEEGPKFGEGLADAFDVGAV